MQVRGAHRAALARVEHTVRSASLPTASAPLRGYSPRMRAALVDNHVDEFLQRIGPLLDRLGVHHRDPRLDPGIAARGVVNALALQLDRQIAADFIGAEQCRSPRARPSHSPSWSRFDLSDG